MKNQKRNLRLSFFNKVSELINQGVVVTDEDYEQLECVTNVDKHEWKLDTSQRSNSYVCDKCGARWNSKIG